MTGYCKFCLMFHLALAVASMCPDKLPLPEVRLNMDRLECRFPPTSRLNDTDSSARWLINNTRYDESDSLSWSNFEQGDRIQCALWIGGRLTNWGPAAVVNPSGVLEREGMTKVTIHPNDEILKLESGVQILPTNISRIEQIRAIGNCNKTLIGVLNTENLNVTTFSVNTLSNENALFSLKDWTLQMNWTKIFTSSCESMFNISITITLPGDRSFYAYYEVTVMEDVQTTTSSTYGKPSESHTTSSTYTTEDSTYGTLSGSHTTAIPSSKSDFCLYFWIAVVAVSLIFVGCSIALLGVLCYNRKRKDSQLVNLDNSPVSDCDTPEEIASQHELRQVDQDSQVFPLSQAIYDESAEQVRAYQTSMRLHQRYTQSTRELTNSRVPDQLVMNPIPLFCQTFTQTSTPTSSAAMPGELLPGTASTTAPPTIAPPMGMQLDDNSEPNGDSARGHTVAAAPSETDPSVVHYVSNRPAMVLPSDPRSLVALPQGSHLVPVVFVPQGNICHYPVQSMQPQATGNIPR